MTITFKRKGADTSYDRPTGADYARAGYTAVMRYITDPGPGNKGITIAEIHDLTAHKIAYGLVWELGSEAVLSGHAQGVADAENAQANLNALAVQTGGPSNKRPIYFAIDFDITPSQIGAAEAYFRGAASVIGANRVGVYGSGYAVDYLFERKLAAFGWWVKAASAWGGGHVPDMAHVHIQQTQNAVVCGSGTIDRDLMRTTGNWGQSGVLTLKPAPKPIPAAPKPDPELFYTVKAGDTLTTVAGKYKTTLHALDVLNPTIKDLDQIYPGERVRVK